MVMFFREIIFTVDKISDQQFSFRNYLCWYITSFCKILNYFAQQLSYFTHATKLKNNPLKLQGIQARPWAV